MARDLHDLPLCLPTHISSPSPLHALCYRHRAFITVPPLPLAQAHLRAFALAVCPPIAALGCLLQFTKTSPSHLSSPTPTLPIIFFIVLIFQHTVCYNYS